MKYWQCTVCGYVHQGDEPPAKCPNCGAPKEKFREFKPGSEQIVMPYAQKMSYGAEVEVNPFFGDYRSIAPFIYNLPVAKSVRRHKHPTSDELFFVLKGKLRFRVGDRQFTAVAGDVVEGKMDIPHAFENIGDEPAVFLSVKGPKPVSTEFVE